jgi:hypothetical protein
MENITFVTNIKSMKIIFLDHDGVICLSHNWGSRLKKAEKWKRENPFSKLSDVPIEYRFDNFDPKSIKVLNSILESTDAEIIISSDWRLHATVEEMGQYYEIQGIIKKPIGYTKVFHYTNWLDDGFLPSESEDFPWSRSDGREQERFFEITRWMEENEKELEVTSWVAVDDLHMGKNVAASSYGPYERDWGLENFVWTPRDFEGIKQSGVKDKIIKFLI